mgnify:FL=1
MLPTFRRTLKNFWNIFIVAVPWFDLRVPGKHPAWLAYLE